MRATVSIFPSETERRWELGKIGDIRALDEIAKEQEALGNHRFAYRPRTCFGVGKCTLADLDDNDLVVLKRSHSAASEHVIITKAGNRDRLLYYRQDARELDGRPPRDPGHWFHQEYVPNLQSFGKFRAFIACDGAPEKARVVSVAHTKPKDNVVAVYAFSSVAFDERKSYMTQMAEMKEFALFIHGKLLSQYNAQGRFQSLQVGVRLDIGRSEDGRWFVGEVTRAFDADQFAGYHLPYPHTHIAVAFAEAFRQYCTREQMVPAAMRG
ncbi:hypothetical protein MMYC01_209300 [Madurella mycetomatis]|uniref:Uncharacterized protein n=1 Tax=Madurella mycetomatis TaxID=100816 RepID=A0A175W156_9PEZI|nr:hypothetical protein MMYC01_209300 [Madurella mycetomatis]